MEKQITVKNEFNTMDKVLSFLKNETHYTCSKQYDVWDMRTDEQGQMEQCVILKKSSMHGMKVYFPSENTLVMSYVIPNKIMNAYFGKSQKRYRNIIEIATEQISQVLLSGVQKNAFTEIEKVFHKIEA